MSGPLQPCSEPTIGSTMPDRFLGRTLLVTGSTGIAAATAERVAAEGGRVFVISRSPDHAAALADRVSGGWAAADLADEAAVDTAVVAAVAHLGRIDAAFSAAGGSGRRFGDGPIHQLSAAAWEATAGVNLRTQVLVCGRVVRAMREQALDASGRRGSLLLLGSVTATAPVPEWFGTHAYATAKGALTALMTSLAATYIADRIRVNLLVPSLTATPMAARAAADERILAYAARKQPLAGSMLDPDEVAKAALFFLSDESRTVTGQTLAVDGGWSIVSTGAGPT
jgi:NAD(P)-dependent dehydrogenase (short-subunit alcohol dehydrogenase family)